jgi:predicted RNase H-like HicB family nuclease
LGFGCKVCGGGAIAFHKVAQNPGAGGTIFLVQHDLLLGGSMSQSFILEYWNDDNWLVGRLKGIPGVFSQGQTLAELEENIRDAYQLMNMEAEPAPAEVKTKELVLEI